MGAETGFQWEIEPDFLTGMIVVTWIFSLEGLVSDPVQSGPNWSTLFLWSKFGPEYSRFMPVKFGVLDHFGSVFIAESPQ